MINPNQLQDGQSLPLHEQDLREAYSGASLESGSQTLSSVGALGDVALESSLGASDEHNYSGSFASEVGEFQGVHIEMLSKKSEGMPLLEVFAMPDEIQAAFHEHVKNGEDIRILQPQEEPYADERKRRVSASVSISQSQYDEGVARGELVPNVTPLGNRKGFMSETEAEQSGLLHRFVESEQEALTSNVDRMWSVCSDADYMEIDGDVLNRTPNIMQAFELSSFGKTVRLYNFSDNPVTERHMAKISEGLRHMGNLTGETTMEALSVLAVVDEKDPVWGTFDLEKGASRTNASTRGGTVILNSHLFTEEWERQNNNRVAGESYAVNGGLEGIVIHEAHHVLVNRGRALGTERAFSEEVGWKKFEDGTMRDEDGSSPSRYGQSKPPEDLAETGTA